MTQKQISDTLLIQQAKMVDNKIKHVMRLIPIKLIEFCLHNNLL